MLRDSFWRPALAVLVVAAMSCGGDHTVIAPPPPHPEFSIASGNNQTALNWTQLPVALSARLIMSDGTPLVNVPVEWTVTDGGGSLQSASTLTGFAGDATATLRLGKVGNQAVQARIPKYGLAVTFTETAIKPPPRVFVLHYDGTSWTPALQDTTGSYAVGYAIWGTSDSDFYVAGGACTSRMLVHVTGAGSTGLYPCDNPNPTWLFSHYSSLSGNSSGDLYATVGEAMSPPGTIYHVGGPTTGMSYTSNPLRFFHAVWTGGPTRVVGVGEDIIARYDGSTWTQSSAGGAYLNAVWGDSSSSAVFAVGDAGAILYYDGTTWQRQTSGTTQTLKGVWGASTTDVFAVGASGTILHFDGNVWSPQSAPPGASLNGVWGSSSNSVFAVGNGVILHFDGASWTQQPMGKQMNLNAVWGTSPTNVYAVGAEISQ